MWPGNFRDIFKLFYVAAVVVAAVAVLLNLLLFVVSHDVHTLPILSNWLITIGWKYCRICTIGCARDIYVITALY